MGNYVGRFKNIETDDSYELYIIGDTANTNVATYTEVLLAGRDPFVVSYRGNKTPFDAVRTSTATIKVVHNDYMEDILTPFARTTQVKLKNVTQNVWEWVGYLTPRVYDAAYVHCEYETFDLEAADCLSSLQYVPYVDVDDPQYSAYTKSIVTFKYIIDNACDACGLLDGYYWGRNKRLGPNSNSTIVLPSMLKISEANFFFSDTNKPWDYLTVLEEMARYLGFTLMQWQSRLYFVDYQTFHNNESFSVTPYLKASGYAQGSTTSLSSSITATQDDYRASNASISFDPQYNKCSVHANFYTCDDLIPSIFDDAYLHNRRDPDNFYANVEVIPETPDPAEYPANIRPNGTTKYKNEKKENDKGKKVDALDSDYRYFYRLYDHDYWQSQYYSTGGTQTTPSTYQLSSQTITRNFMGGTIVDLGVVRKKYVNQYYQEIVPNKLDYTRYLCLSCKCNTANTSTHWDSTSFSVVDDSPMYVLFKSKPGMIAPCMTSSNAFLVINFTMLWERYVNRAYINPDWCSDECGVSGWQETWHLDYLQRAVGCMRFRIKVGNKYWSGKDNDWSTASTSVAYVTTKREDENYDRWNTEESTLNNISWEEELSAEGYKIPLRGVDMSQGISIEILRPYFQFVYVDGNWKSYDWNQYCWVKDLSIKVVEAGHENDTEDDILYENIISSDSVNEMSDITVKFTTYDNLNKAAYSNVILATGNTNSLLEYIYEPCLSNALQKPEENIVEKYVSQYSSQTKTIQATLGLNYTPFTKVYGIDVYEPNQGYCQTATEIDYRMGRQKITLVEKK